MVELSFLAEMRDRNRAPTPQTYHPRRVTAPAVTPRAQHSSATRAPVHSTIKTSGYFRGDSISIFVLQLLLLLHAAGSCFCMLLLLLRAVCCVMGSAAAMLFVRRLLRPFINLREPTCCRTATAMRRHRLLGRFVAGSGMRCGLLPRTVSA